MEDFDQAAAHYGSDFEENPLALHQRKMVYMRLSGVVVKGTRVLELGCGTGIDAMWMAARGARILATDASPEMISALKNRAASSNCLGAVDAQVWKMPALFSLPDASVDVVFSNFGALNCLSPDALKTVIGECRRVLAPGGLVFLVLMPRLCLWECVYFMMKRNLRLAFRRHGPGPKMISYHGATIETYFYSPRYVRRLMMDSFHHLSFRPMGLWSPFPGLEKFWKRAAVFFRWTWALDRLFFRVKIGASCSDHYAVEGIRL